MTMVSKTVGYRVELHDGKTGELLNATEFFLCESAYALTAAGQTKRCWQRLYPDDRVTLLTLVRSPLREAHEPYL